MTGRLIHEAPVCNAHGVPYKRLYEQERQASARLVGLLAAALGMWLRADALGPNSRKRWALMKQARVLSEKALS